ncbi:MAG: hypothetical protein MUF01_17310 [Bryobacterales bacterium]|jgi:hypothetical protein|nr:hypothetical protein [Bryobacterales bacterium]
MSTHHPQAIQDAVETLAANYAIEDPDALADFLTRHPKIIPYLEGSVPHIEKHFPGAPRALVVELDEDEELGAESLTRLYILVQAASHSATAHERMDRLDDEWGLDLCEDTNELVVIDLDYT